MALNIKSIVMAELRDRNSYAPYTVFTYRAYTEHIVHCQWAYIEKFSIVYNLAAAQNMHNIKWNYV